MNVTENEFDAGAILGHLTDAQRQHLNALDAAFADLLARPAMNPAAVERLADAIVSLYDEIADARSGRENRV
ncbi:hypothetical protein DTW90_12510 [Neorhizobium sp. P12A]|uniref:hypothetical protein n=1 Tax=Neorhizobium sp. P12A TaxID=2268027 RepID=UPI0011ED125F|nr:hypothetical protein [Neorhizobium sp. P12A]KAA0698609.1 hypothetical protein DTW90_12510 [Neorhizobium sp. P12A]